MRPARAVFAGVARVTDGEAQTMPSEVTIRLLRDRYDALHRLAQLEYDVSEAGRGAVPHDRIPPLPPQGLEVHAVRPVSRTQ